VLFRSKRSIETLLRLQLEKSRVPHQKGKQMSKIEVRKHKTLRQFVSDCGASGIIMARVTERGSVEFVSRNRMEPRLTVTVTACSRKSPVLRIWSTWRQPIETVKLLLEFEGISVSDGEWKPEILEMLLG
jgi:hypothetical protein